MLISLLFVLGQKTKKRAVTHLHLQRQRHLCWLEIEGSGISGNAQGQRAVSSATLIGAVNVAANN